MHAQLASWIAAARKIVVFTGAGISTESGIPDFRSPGGVWSQSQPVFFEEFLRSSSARDEYWRQKSITHREFASAHPNLGHRVLADWERRGLIRGVITQNIDGLHQQAGSQAVLELHGTAREVACLGCQKRWPADEWVAWYEEHLQAPDCPDCGGPLKHATISFGQSLDPQVLEQAARWSTDCDLFLALGSSLVVQPAAGLPVLAQSQGARLVIINRDPTPLDTNADLRLAGPLGETLGQVDATLAGTVQAST
ncbi:MAG: NAD-dependent protein deacylase [Planctomycetaceae bacterium]|nr:MAG: NAD-dependent protein deacylase [Planctomycetaceae bacterium]